MHRFFSFNNSVFICFKLHIFLKIVTQGHFFHCFLEREGGRERSINQLPPVCAQSRAHTHNPGLCPDRELNPQPFSYRMIPQLSHTGQGNSTHIEKN